MARALQTGRVSRPHPDANNPSGPGGGGKGASRSLPVRERWPLTNGRLQPNGDPSEAANDLAPLSTPPSPTPRSWTIGAGGMGGSVRGAGLLREGAWLGVPSHLPTSA